MAIQVMRITVSETTIALANTTIAGYIDNFYASIDANYTPSSMEIDAILYLTVQNAGGDERTFCLRFNWYEDAAVINTIIKNILTAFTNGITAMEGASSYTVVQLLYGSIILTIAYT